MQEGKDDDVSDEAFKEAMDIIAEVKQRSEGMFEPWDENESDR
jgi:hypothetical protein